MGWYRLSLPLIPREKTATVTLTMFLSHKMERLRVPTSGANEDMNEFLDVTCLEQRLAQDRGSINIDSGHCCSDNTWGELLMLTDAVRVKWGSRRVMCVGQAPVLPEGSQAHGPSSVPFPKKRLQLCTCYCQS